MPEFCAEHRPESLARRGGLLFSKCGQILATTREHTKVDWNTLSGKTSLALVGVKALDPLAFVIPAGTLLVLISS